jgi:predicted phosphodiesterase
MKYAILGDIHSNLEALQAVLKDAENNLVTHFICIGDIVGYGADPKACLDVIRSLNAPTVKGNHDEYSAVDSQLVGFNPVAAESLMHSRRQLTPEDKEWLRGLRYVRHVESFTIVHATLDMPHRWGYVFDRLAAAASMTYQTTQVCFFGHTHVPLAFIKEGGVRGGLYQNIQLELGRKYFVNVGSVGQPRDGDPRAAYVIFDLIENKISLQRVEYDYTITQKKILDADLPPRLAERIALGK